MKEKPLVTICLHTGKLKNYPLIENFIKSFLVCNFYENVELMLIESSGSKELRTWFENLDFEDFFVNFSGKKSNIKKRKNISIKKSLKFYDFPETDLWFQCYTKSIQRAINDASGKYFCFFAEDNQFTIKGNIIDDYIKILEEENNFKSFVHFFGQQKYKFFKENNYFSKIPQTIEDIKYFKPSHKWDFWSLTLKENYEKIGSLKESTKDKPHNTIEEYSRRTKDQNFVRVYPKIPHGIWFHNKSNQKIINMIKSNHNNPDFICYKIIDKSEAIEIFKDNMPISTDDYLQKVCL